MLGELLEVFFHFSADNKYGGHVRDTTVSYPARSGFKYGLEDGLFSFRCSEVFLVHSRQIMGLHLNYADSLQILSRSLLVTVLLFDAI
jgi:hypothetical protein